MVAITLFRCHLVLGIGGLFTLLITVEFDLESEMFLILLVEACAEQGAVSITETRDKASTRRRLHPCHMPIHVFILQKTVFVIDHVDFTL